MGSLAFSDTDNTYPGVPANKRQPPLHVLRYRPHLHVIYTILNTAGTLLCLIGAAGAAYAMSLHNAKAFAAFAVPIVVGSLIIAEAMFLLKPLIDARIEIFHDRFIIRRFKKSKIEFRFEDLEEIHFVLAGFAGGWFHVKRFADPKKYRFSVMLENSYSIVQAIERARPALFKSKFRVEKFKRAMINADHAWQRYHDILGDWMMLIFKYAVFPGAGVMVMVDAVMRSHRVANDYKEFAGLVAGAGFLGACLATGWAWFLIKEKLITGRIERMTFVRHAPLVIPRDKKFEGRLDLVGQVLYFGLGLGLIVYAILMN